MHSSRDAREPAAFTLGKSVIGELESGVERSIVHASASSRRSEKRSVRMKAADSLSGGLMLHWRRRLSEVGLEI